MRNIDIILEIIEKSKTSVRTIEAAASMGNGTLKKTYDSDGDLSNENLQKFLDSHGHLLTKAGFKVIENKDPYGKMISKSIVKIEYEESKPSETLSVGSESLPALIKVMTKLMETQNGILAEQKGVVASKVKQLESNLNKTHEQVKAAARKQIARTSVMMEALDTLTKSPKGTLSAKSDIIEDALRKADSGDGRMID